MARKFIVIFLKSVIFEMFVIKVYPYLQHMQVQYPLFTISTSLKTNFTKYTQGRTELNTTNTLKEPC